MLTPGKGQQEGGSRSRLTRCYGVAHLPDFDPRATPPPLAHVTRLQSVAGVGSGPELRRGRAECGRPTLPHPTLPRPRPAPPPPRHDQGHPHLQQPRQTAPLQVLPALCTGRGAGERAGPRVSRPRCGVSPRARGRWERGPGAVLLILFCTGTHFSIAEGCPGPSVWGRWAPSSASPSPPPGWSSARRQGERHVFPRFSP